VQRETRDLWAAVVATGLFLACYRISGAWLDLARVDALFLALTLGGVLLARTRRAATVVLAGALTGAAVQTKQQALIIGLAVAVALWREERARAVRYVVGLVGTVAVVSAALEVASGGWFHVYAVELLVRHEIVDAEVLDFWTHDLWQPLAIAVVLTVALFLLPGRLERATRRFYALVTIGCVVAAYSSRLHSGGYDNVLLPAYAAVAVTFGLALHHLGHAGPRVSRALARVVLVAAVVQFGVLLYDPAAQIPTATAVARGDALLAELRRLPGPIAVFGHGWYAERVGHAQVAQCAAVDDVLRAHLDGVSDRLAATRARALRGHRYRAVIVDSQRSLACVPADLARYYRPAYRLRSPWPLTGTPTRPFTVWVPRP